MEIIAITLSILTLGFMGYEYYKRKDLDIYFYSTMGINFGLVGGIFWFATSILNFYESNKQIALLFFFLGILYILSNNRRDIISDRGVYTNNGSFKWKDIKSFHWKDQSKRKKNYYPLYFKTDEDKFIFRVREEDKDELDKFLMEKFGEKEVDM